MLVLVNMHRPATNWQLHIAVMGGAPASTGSSAVADDLASALSGCAANQRTGQRHKHCSLAWRGEGAHS